MAFFLLLYVLFVLVWLIWVGILLYHAYKYRFPNDKESYIIYVFLAVSGLILLISIFFISGADWTVVPKIMGGN